LKEIEITKSFIPSLLAQNEFAEYFLSLTADVSLRTPHYL
jgi:hypothetical protein